MEFISHALKGKKIFLSAVFPGKFEGLHNYDPQEITDAVVSFSRQIFYNDGEIVLPYHPTIVSLVLSIANDFLPLFDKTDLPIIHIYIPINLPFSVFILQEITKENLGDITMCGENIPLKELGIVAGIFIGDPTPVIDFRAVFS